MERPGMTTLIVGIGLAMTFGFVFALFLLYDTLCIYGTQFYLPILQRNIVKNEPEVIASPVPTIRVVMIQWTTKF